MICPMNKPSLVIALATLGLSAAAATQEMYSPDKRLAVTLDCPDGGAPTYSVAYDGQEMLLPSPLGFIANIGDFATRLTLIDTKEQPIQDSYTLSRSKKSHIDYSANEYTCRFSNDAGQKFSIQFRISDNDVAYRYQIPVEGDTRSIRIMSEATGFRFPDFATTFLTPQSDAMIGWKRTKPSYEEPYQADAPLQTKSMYGHGYTFPALFRIGDNGWVLLSETGVDSRYCGSRLTDIDPNNTYYISFPMPEENNGNGTVEPAFALPGATPWRTITVGSTLAPIVETTVPWDVVKPQFGPTKDYKPARGVWSWILWGDDSINFEDQKKYIDFAKAMGWEYVLIDNWWDNNMGRERMAELSKYAQSQGVNLLIWYSSSGYWNDIEQGPINVMDRSIRRKHEMQWLKEIGAKGIKVDFFGGDKQETMRLYEEILSDANDAGLMVIFHGCTIPRGWERMYPNYIGSEAVLASENMTFNQSFCDGEAFNACLHPFIRNAIGCMEFGGTFLNKRLDRTNQKGPERRTTDSFELATAILFQNPQQNFALAPNNLEDAPDWAIEFMQAVPTTWDDVKFIDGYPGRYAVVARQHDGQWYVAAISALDEPLKLDLDLPMLNGQPATLVHNGKSTLKPTKKGRYQLTLAPQDGAVLIQ